MVAHTRLYATYILVRSQTLNTSNKPHTLTCKVTSAVVGQEAGRHSRYPPLPLDSGRSDSIGETVVTSSHNMEDGRVCDQQSRDEGPILAGAACFDDRYVVCHAMTEEPGTARPPAKKHVCISVSLTVEHREHSIVAQGHVT